MLVHTLQLTHNSPPMFHKQILSIQMKEQKKKQLSENIYYFFFLHLGQCGIE